MLDRLAEHVRGATLLRKLERHWGQEILSHLVTDDPPSAVPLSVMIPVAPKDACRLRVTLPALRRHLAHPIERLAIVAPDDPAIRAAAEELEAEFIPEDPVLAPLLEGAPTRATGWIRQQLLKLTCHRIMGAERVFTIDSDTAPIRPFRTIDGEGRTILLRGDRSAMRFDRFVRSALGAEVLPRTSFVAHSMLFEARHLDALDAEIRRRHGIGTVDFALKAAADKRLGHVSEFQLYGQFLAANAPDEIAIRYYAARKVPPAAFLGRDALPRSARRFRFVSNHERGKG